MIHDPYQKSLKTVAKHKKQTRYKKNHKEQEENMSSLESLHDSSPDERGNEQEDEDCREKRTHKQWLNLLLSKLLVLDFGFI